MYSKFTIICIPKYTFFCALLNHSIANILGTSWKPFGKENRRLGNQAVYLSWALSPFICYGASPNISRLEITLLLIFNHSPLSFASQLIYGMFLVFSVISILLEANLYLGLHLQMQYGKVWKNPIEIEVSWSSIAKMFWCPPSPPGEAATPMYVRWAWCQGHLAQWDSKWCVTTQNWKEKRAILLKDSKPKELWQQHGTHCIKEEGYAKSCKPPGSLGRLHAVRSMFSCHWRCCGTVGAHTPDPDPPLQTIIVASTSK